ncbi:hypothetical protein FQN57_005173 [Myotisia sp. PD_48]|nr:hypothetical protein FQN57_005173 [Myotisia sp. PD_48]
MSGLVDGFPIESVHSAIPKTDHNVVNTNKLVYLCVKWSLLLRDLLPPDQYHMVPTQIADAISWFIQMPLPLTQRLATGSASSSPDRQRTPSRSPARAAGHAVALQPVSRPPAPIAPPAPPAPVSHLEQLWKGTRNKVGAGGVIYEQLDLRHPAKYAASEITGCTVVVVIDGMNIVLGHFAEESRGGEGYTLENPAATDKIVKKLDNEMVAGDWTTQAVAYIVHSNNTSTGKKGVQKLEACLKKHQVPAANIREHRYHAGASTVGHRGKVVVTLDPLPAGRAMLRLYISNDTPVYTRQL